MSVKKTPSGYQVDWRDAGGSRRRKSFRAKGAAEQHERQMIDQREQGILPVHGSGTLGDFLPEWEKTVYPGLRENTRQGYAGAVRKHIRPRFGDVKLRQIDQRAVQDWMGDLVAARKENGDPLYSPRTVEFVFAVFSTIMKLASEYGMCRPIRKSGRASGGVRLPKKHKQHLTPPTISQIEQLCQVVDPRFGAAGIRVAGYCGLRQSEIFGLHPTAIDFANHRIHIYQTIEHATGSLSETKSGKDRWVPMFQIVEDALRAYMAEYPHPSFVFTMNGHHYDSGHWHRDIWKPARRDAGLDGIKFHSLRHSAASIMIAAGWDAKRVQLALGHHSVAFTFDQYGHLFPTDEESARTTLNTALEQAIAAAKSAGDGSRTHTGQSPDDLESPASAIPPHRPDDDTTEGASQ